MTVQYNRQYILHCTLNVRSREGDEEEEWENGKRDGEEGREGD